MKNKSIGILLVCVLFVVFLLGVTDVITLADKDQSAESVNTIQPDKLIGVLVTPEYLDLFNFDSYFEDNIDALTANNGVVTIDSSEYEGRLYATLVDNTVVDSFGERKTPEYVFENVEGYLFYTATMKDEYGTYSSGSSDEAFSDGHSVFHSLDEGERIEIQSTIYVSTLSDIHTFYYNPVYQTADGKVYALSGTGHSYGSELTEGLTNTVSYEESSSHTANGVTITDSMRVEVTCKYVNPPTSIVITQMNDNNQILTSTVYEPDKLPDSITPMDETDYILLEILATDYYGNQVSNRELFEDNDTYLEPYYCREDGICVKKFIQLEWGE